MLSTSKNALLLVSSLALGACATSTRLDLGTGESRRSTAPAVAVHADAPSKGNVYVRAQYGLGLLADGDLDQGGTGGNVAGDAEYDAGFLGGLAIGYRAAPNWSFEGELMYRSNDIDSLINRDTGALRASSGDFASLALMANARYHFRPGEDFQPYVGVGVGLVEEIDVDIDFPNTQQERSFSDVALGLQAMVGAKYGLTDRISLSAEARYFTALGFDLDGEGASSGATFDGDYNHVGFLLGVSYDF